MAAKIRLSRVGKRGLAQYRIVVTDRQKKRDGRQIEIVGTYNPGTNPPTVHLKKERITYWREKGAELSNTVRNLLT